MRILDVAPSAACSRTHCHINAPQQAGQLDGDYALRHLLADGNSDNLLLVCILGRGLPRCSDGVRNDALARPNVTSDVSAMIQPALRLNMSAFDRFVAINSARRMSLKGRPATPGCAIPPPYS